MMHVTPGAPLPVMPEWLQDITLHPRGDAISMLCQQCGEEFGLAAPFEDAESIWSAAFAHRHHYCKRRHPPGTGYRYTAQR